MIIRQDAYEGLTLIKQTDHSRFVGQLAAHWGNETFAKPHPFDSVVRGAAFHDYGWLNYEANPTYDAATGTMPHFTSPPPGVAHYDHYQWCNDWMTDIDPYAGLLINMHRTGLWRNRHDVLAYPQGYNIKHMTPEAEVFVTNNEALQAEIRGKFPEEEVRGNYWLLQVLDLIGLYFCCKEPTEDYIEPVPFGYQTPKGEGAHLSMKPLGGSDVSFDPFPFDVEPLPIKLICTRLPSKKFKDASAFRQTYFQAPTTILEYRLVRSS